VRRPPLFALASCLCALASGPRAGAAPCPGPPGASPSVSTIDGRERLLWIDRLLQEQASRGRWWAGSWAMGIGAAGVASLVAVPFVEPSTRVDWYTGAVTAAVGVVPFALSPLKVTRDAPRLHEALAATPLDDGARVCSLLADAEVMLRRDADDERWQHAWWIHAGNLAFNTGVLLFLGLGFHHWGAGLINGLSGAAVGEAIIFTQPTAAIDEAASYDRGDLSAWTPHRVLGLAVRL
jgi:hypothetical protein